MVGEKSTDIEGKTGLVAVLALVLELVWGEADSSTLAARRTGR